LPKLLKQLPFCLGKVIGIGMGVGLSLFFLLPFFLEKRLKVFVAPQRKNPFVIESCHPFLNLLFD